MAKLMKAQMGKIVKGAIKAVAKEAKPVVKAVKKPSFMDFRTTDTKNTMKEALGKYEQMQERARLKAHLESLSKKQMGGSSKPTPSKPINFKEAKAKAKYNPNLIEEKERAIKNSPKYKIENYKPYKPMVAKNGGIIKTKKK